MRFIAPRLVSIRGTYYFRMAVPEDLRPAIGRREFKRRLGVLTFHIAAAKAETIGALLKHVFNEIRLGMTPPEQQDIDRLISQLVAEEYHGDLARDEYVRMRRNRVKPEDLDQERRRIEHRISQLRFALACNDTPTIMDAAYWLVAEREDLQDTFPVNSDEFRKLAREMTKAQIEALKIQVERCQGNYDNPHDAPQLETVLRPPAPVTTDKPRKIHTLGDLQRKYVKEAHTGKKWAPKTTATVTASFALLAEIFGEDANMNTFDYDALLDFRDNYLCKLPPNRSKVKRYRGKTVREIVAMPDVTPMSDATIRKYVTWISTFFKWCSQHDYIPKNPALGLVPSKTSKASSERDSFAPDQLQKMITAFAEERTIHADRPERQWIPLISLYSGMRQNEICQLYCDDIREEDGIWCFDVNNKADKHLKTDAGDRIIPIHPQLLDLGFLNYAAALRAAGEERLWPNLVRRRDGYGQDFSRWFGRFKNLNITDDRKKVFHSLRHNVADALKQAGVQEAAIAEILGHENQSITTGRYGKRLRPKPLLKALKNLDYGLDLSLLQEYS